MKKSLGLSLTVATTFAMLMGCSESGVNKSTALDSNTITLGGIVNAASMEEVVVEDVSGEVIATDTVKEDGTYEVVITEDDNNKIEFPVILRVKKANGEVRAVVARPDSAHHRKIVADINEISEMVVEHYKEFADSLKALRPDHIKECHRIKSAEWLQIKDPCAMIIAEKSSEAMVRDSLIETLEGEELFVALKERMQQNYEICSSNLPLLPPKEFLEYGKDSLSIETRDSLKVQFEEMQNAINDEIKKQTELKGEQLTYEEILAIKEAIRAQMIETTDSEESI